MKTILKTQFKTHKIMRKTRGVRKKESSVHQTGHGEWGLGVWGFGCDCIAGGYVRRSPYITGMTRRELSVFILESKLTGFDT